ncbi:hypothetical protein [Peribacillus asahii]|uniref:hypothetical protein n=1 Tax=Peribacillus asahii TaxID=228899 RepID=UPI00381F17AC
METNALFYKIQKETVSTEDYVNWSHSLLENNVSSPSINIISSFSFGDSIFKVEVYFKRALNELEIQKPTFEISARAYIGFLANKIIKVNNHSEMFELAYTIFRIVDTELHNLDDLLEWYEISEMIDRLQYDDVPLEFNEVEVISRIKNEAKIFLGLND